MRVGLARAVLASLLLLGCTGLNPLYADATGGQKDNGPSTTTHDATGPNRSTPADPSQPTTLPTLEPTNGSGGSTAAVGPGTGETGTGPAESGGATTGVTQGDCSTYVQDCPPEQKCMPWASQGEDTWNALDCFVLDPDPGVPGDVCTVVETAMSGLDDCDETSMCWDVDLGTNTGTCAPFCSGSPEVPTCENPEHTCVQRNAGVIALCLPQCDPLVQNCAIGSMCAPGGNAGFACVPDASMTGGGVGAVCEYVNDCQPGNVCITEAFLLGCEASGCCTPYCDLTKGDPCAGPSVCVTFYDEGPAPPGYENVGFCGMG